ncbi:hypothetical protein VP01_120g5 [Puccinia sorghi]|uniref:Lysophospholipase n=1 Tax=Puccinia sorghi TaxID=27349 RepID=A0A0L6VQB7_9BASI|nr:hypothetical protein VP01_120g5 [Puccinia sorghi]
MPSSKLSKPVFPLCIGDVFSVSLKHAWNKIPGTTRVWMRILATAFEDHPGLLYEMVFLKFVVVAHCLLLLAQSTESTARCVLQRRDPALTTSPSGNYAPIYDTCPANLFLREPNKLTNGMAQLSQAEHDYITQKAQKSIDPWRKYLQNVKLKDFDIDSFLKQAEKRGGLAGDTLPNFGLSLSGGGGRALCLSGSILEAFDSRNPRADAAKVGGILQLSNYAVGVSGCVNNYSISARAMQVGYWELGWATSNFPPISSISPKWRLSEQNDLWDWNVMKHYRKVYKTVKKKKEAGFETNIFLGPPSFSTFYVRYHIFFYGANLILRTTDPLDPHQGEGVLWSSIGQTPLYKDRQVPYVIAVATSRPGIKEDFTPYSPIYEFSAEEFGVFHPRLNASIPMKYLGSPQNLNGRFSTCVRGYDNAGFIMGLSSNIYSLIDSPSDHKPLFLRVIDKFTDDDNFEGKVPNTFQNLGEISNDESPGFQDNEHDTILMADCGLINESIPIYSLLQPERKIDAIIAVDAVSDLLISEYRWQGNRSHLVTILIRWLNRQYRSQWNSIILFIFEDAAPVVPRETHAKVGRIPNSVNGSFTELGYHRRPTFFGCNDFKGPLIIYLPNYYAVGETNQPTLKTTYTPEEIQVFYENGFAIATQNAGPTKNPGWPACLACALIDRQVLRNSGSRTAECQACFRQYCAKE